MEQTNQLIELVDITDGHRMASVAPRFEPVIRALWSAGMNVIDVIELDESDKVRRVYFTFTDQPDMMNLIQMLWQCAPEYRRNFSEFVNGYSEWAVTAANAIDPITGPVMFLSFSVPVADFSIVEKVVLDFMTRADNPYDPADRDPHANCSHPRTAIRERNQAFDLPDLNKRVVDPKLLN